MNNQVPFQVEKIISDMLNKAENVHLRQNYRQRLVNINEAIDKALRMYDNEAYIAKVRKKQA